MDGTIKNMDDKFDLPPIAETEKIAEKIRPLKKLYDEALEKDRTVNFKKIHEFGRELDKKYKNARDYRLYHLLIGGSVCKEYPYYDFEGEDSIEKFIKSL